MFRFFGKHKNIAGEVFSFIYIDNKDAKQVITTSFAIGALQAYLDCPKFIQKNEILRKQAEEVEMYINSSNTKIAYYARESYLKGYRWVVNGYNTDTQYTINTSKLHRALPLEQSYLREKAVADKMAEMIEQRQIDEISKMVDHTLNTTTAIYDVD